MKTETFFAIRRTDGEDIYGEFAWMGCSGPDDWTVADESDHDDATEYEIVRMTVESISKRTFGDPRDLHVRVGPVGDERDAFRCDYCDEPWPCEFMAELVPETGAAS